MAEVGCNVGQKFVIKVTKCFVSEYLSFAQSPKGTRRQFLMLDGAKIIAFLKIGQKITDCVGTLTDVTNRVSCKV